VQLYANWEDCIKSCNRNDLNSCVFIQLYSHGTHWHDISQLRIQKGNKTNQSSSPVAPEVVHFSPTVAGAVVSKCLSQCPVCVSTHSQLHKKQPSIWFIINSHPLTHDETDGCSAIFIEMFTTRTAVSHRDTGHIRLASAASWPARNSTAPPMDSWHENVDTPVTGCESVNTPRLC